MQTEVTKAAKAMKAAQEGRAKYRAALRELLMEYPLKTLGLPDDFNEVIEAGYQRLSH